MDYIATGIWSTFYLFQDWMSLGTFALDMDAASEKMRPRADVSGIVLRALRKLAG